MLMFVSFLFHVISIHAPREGSDQGVHDFFCRARQISIHAPREGSDPRHRQAAGGEPISIHAPREGSDGPGPQFRPLLSPISIHAPREGSDWPAGRVVTCPTYFYPRSPRGERRVFTTSFAAPDRFLSTLPARGATRPSTVSSRVPEISIHAPREGSDLDLGQVVEGLAISIHAPREGSDPSCGRP